MEHCPSELDVESMDQEPECDRTQSEDDRSDDEQLFDESIERIWSIAVLCDRQLGSARLGSRGIARYATRSTPHRRASYIFLTWFETRVLGGRGYDWVRGSRSP